MRLFGAALFAFGLTVAKNGLAADATGDYSATALKVSWAVGDWGEACGPRPSGGGEAGGTFHVAQSGSELSLSGPRSYKTTGCWEPMPGLRTTSHQSGEYQITTVCKMPPGDPRQTTITTTWALRGDKIYFDEVGQYQFVLSGQNCTASSRKTRVLSKIVVAPPAAAASAVPPVLAPPPSEPHPVEPKKAKEPPRPTPSCVSTGAIAQLTLSPKTKLMLAGESYSFRVTALDHKGCLVRTQPSFSVRSGAELIDLTRQGLVTVKAGAASGRATLEVRSGNTTLEAFVKVVSRDEYERLLGAGNFSETGESLEDAQVSHALVTLAREEGENRSLLWIALAAIGALSAGIGAVVLLRKRDRERKRRLRVSRRSPEVASKSDTAADKPAARGKLCPVCGLDYPPEATFCGSDGAKLVLRN